MLDLIRRIRSWTKSRNVYNNFQSPLPERKRGILFLNLGGNTLVSDYGITMSCQRAKETNVKDDKHILM